jgi:hypothetical protein
MDQRSSQEMRAQTPRNTLGGRRTRMRVLHRRSQGIVAVYEQDPVTVEAGPPTLVFETPAKCTRITQYPAEWQRLSDDELVAIQRSAG